MKPACRGVICKADEDGSRLRFMARSAASYILMLDEQSSQAQNVLHVLRHSAAKCFIIRLVRLGTA